MIAESDLNPGSYYWAMRKGAPFRPTYWEIVLVRSCSDRLVVAECGTSRVREISDFVFECRVGMQESVLQTSDNVASGNALHAQG